MDKEQNKCNFCNQMKPVERQYLHAKVKQPTGDGFDFIYFCNDCGLLETVSEHSQEEQKINEPK